MGSFSELVLSFDFRRDTPPEVLAAFSALAVPVTAGVWWTREPAPDLPEPVVEPAEYWEPDWREAGDEDPYEDEPWRHDWARWLANSMSVGTVPSAQLLWTGRTWSLFVRCSFKSWAEAIHTFLAWLGPYIDGDPDRPVLVGHINDEQDRRPWLLWVTDGKLELEDLNPGR